MVNQVLTHRIHQQDHHLELLISLLIGEAGRQVGIKCAVYNVCKVGATLCLYPGSAHYPTSFSEASGCRGGSMGGRKMGFGDKGRSEAAELSEILSGAETFRWSASTE